MVEGGTKMTQKRFVFDDDTEDLQPTNTIIQNTEQSVEKKNMSAKKNKVKKNNKKKRRLKKRYFLIFILLLIIAFIAYVFIAGSNDGPVYGNRCASLITIDKSKFNGIEEDIKSSNESINQVAIEVDCRIIKITMDFADNTKASDAKKLATSALHTLDDSLKNNKSNKESEYSDLLGMANGRGQYNVEFVLTSNGDTDFPIFGTKHPSSDEISFTGSDVVDQETTDQVLKKSASE